MTQPFLEAIAAALVKRRKAAYNALLTTGKCQLRSGNQKHGGRYQWQIKVVFQKAGHGKWQREWASLRVGD